eukprot:3124866-Amphidinium_carterae.1
MKDPTADWRWHRHNRRPASAGAVGRLPFSVPPLETPPEVLLDCIGMTCMGGLQCVVRSYQRSEQPKRRCKLQEPRLSGCRTLTCASEVSIAAVKAMCHRQQERRERERLKQAELHQAQMVSPDMRLRVKHAVGPMQKLDEKLEATVLEKRRAHWERVMM